jgi:hypothetical protein
MPTALAIICPLPPPYNAGAPRRLDKVHPHRSRRIRAELLQLQTLLADLQGKLAVGHLQRQAQALGPLLGLRFERRARASTWMRQAAGCSIMKTRSKN